MPAPLNLVVPPHRYDDDNTIVVGEDTSGSRVTMAIVPNPHKTTGVLGWIDDRFPLDEDVEGSSDRVLRAEELQLLVLLRLAGTAGRWSTSC